MDNIAERIWNFGQLASDQQAEIEAYVKANPEYKELLEESKALYRLLSEAALFANNPTHDIALTYLVANELIRGKPLPELLERWYKQLENKIDTMPHEKQRYIQIRARMEEIASRNDPVAQFEQLTGYNIEADYNEPLPASRNNSPITGDRSPVSRSMSSRVFKHRWVVPLVLMVVVVGFTIQGNERARNAYTDPQVLLVNGYNQVNRGLDSFEEPVSSDIVFMFAQRALHEAQHVWFGVYYSYDWEGLSEAEALFVRVIEDANVSSFIKEEAMYLLGKVYMAQNEKEKARNIFEDVVQLRSRRSNEAARLKGML